MQKYFFSFILSFIISYFLSLVLGRVKLNFKKEYSINERKIHRKPISHLGGVAIYLGSIVPLFLFLKINLVVSGLLLGGLIIFALGLMDDSLEVSPYFKLTLQSLAALVAIWCNVKIWVLSLPFLGPYSGYINYLVTFFWLIGVTNAFSLIDGLDGLAAGVTIISAVTLAYVAAIHHQGGPIIIAMSLTGASLGFLRFNFHPAKIFMGDAGSLYLGFMLASLAILIGAKKVTFFTLIIPVVALGVPIVDTLLAIFRRFRRGQPIFAADREHLHHRLLSLGISQRRAVLIIYAICLILSLTSIALAELKPLTGVIILFFLSYGLFWLAKNFKLI